MATQKRLLALAAITATSLTMCGFPVHAGAETPYPVYTDAVTVSRITSVYDGDTIRVDIDHWPAIFGKDMSIRLAGIDTPEIRGADCAEEKSLSYVARDRLSALLESADHVELRNLGRDPFFRILAEVWADNTPVAETLIAEGLAHEYHGGDKLSWCPSPTEVSSTLVELPTLVVHSEGA